MTSTKSIALVALLAAVATGCVGRKPVLAPPPADVEAVEGFGQALIEGEEGVLKGRFSFRFRNPDLGRIEALDPLNRTAYFVIIRGGEAYVVVPSKRAYAADQPEALSGRLLGFPFSPGEAVSILSDRWEAGEAGPGQGNWMLVRDSEGRTVHGEKGELSFDIQEFFAKADVPRAIGFSDARGAGRVKVLSVRFNPPPRPEAFEVRFADIFTRVSWEELRELLRDEN